MNRKVYLGDSVYAQFDGYHVILTTENGKPDDPSNRIALENDVIYALEVYLADLRIELFEKAKQT
jgi:hypothetical protein